MRYLSDRAKRAGGVKNAAFADLAGKRRKASLRVKKARAMTDLFPEVAPEVDETGDERYTTRETIEWCKARAGVKAFDLDVAACAESHHAPRWFDKATNGLLQPWNESATWCNPPYSDIAPWVEKAWHEVHEFRRGFVCIAMLIPATRTEQRWWQDNIEPTRDRRDPESSIVLESHFLPGRTSFARPGSGGVGQSGSPFGCVLLVWRRT